MMVPTSDLAKSYTLDCTKLFEELYNAVDLRYFICRSIGDYELVADSTFPSYYISTELVYFNHLFDTNVRLVYHIDVGSLNIILPVSISDLVYESNIPDATHCSLKLQYSMNSVDISKTAVCRFNPSKYALVTVQLS